MISTLCGSAAVGSHRNFKVHHLLGIGTHIVVEAEAIFAGIFGSKNRIQLSLFTIFHDNVVSRPLHAVVDVEGAARLHLL